MNRSRRISLCIIVEEVAAAASSSLAGHTVRTGRGAAAARVPDWHSRTALNFSLHSLLFIYYNNISAVFRPFFCPPHRFFFIESNFSPIKNLKYIIYVYDFFPRKKICIIIYNRNTIYLMIILLNQCIIHIVHPYYILTCRTHALACIHYNDTLSIPTVNIISGQ